MKNFNSLLGKASVLTILLAQSLLAAENGGVETATTEAENVALEPLMAEGSFLYIDQVNALKTPTQIIDVPQSLSIFSSEELALRGLDSIGAIIEYTPGVSITQGEGHRDAIVFRGVRSTADFFVDGIRDDVQYYRPLYNIEQVEILRGPNALFFGRGGTGGIINRATEKGILGEDFNAYSFGIDTFGATNLEWDSNLAVSENAAFRLNVMHDILDNHRDFYDGERFGATPTFRYQVGDRTTVDITYEYMDHERFIDRGIPTGSDLLPAESLKDITFGDPELNISKLDAHIFRTMVQHALSDEIKANLGLSYGNYEKFYQNLYASNYVESTNTVTLSGYNDTVNRDNLVISGNLVGNLSTFDIEHTLVFGTEYVNTASDQNRYNATWTNSGAFIANHPLALSGGIGINSASAATSVTFDTLNDDTRVDINVISLYLQDEIEIIEQLQLVLGVRWDYFDYEVLDVFNSSSRAQTDKEFSPRAGLVYKPIETLSLYASFSQSFLPKSGEQFADLSEDDIGIDPDEFTNLEVGVKWDIQPDLSLTAALFELDQDATENDGFGNYYAVESKVQGFEAQLQGMLSERWSVAAGYSFLDGEIIDKSAGATTNGNRPRELPKHMFSIWNGYRLTEQFGVGMGLVYQQESFITEDNDRKLPSYARLDVSAYYDVSKNVRLQLKIENLTDEVYFPSAHSNHQVTVGAPVNARFTISGRF